MRIGAVLLASGSGSRFGSNKLLHEIQGIPMIRRAFAALPPGLFDRAAVVSCYSEILALAEKHGYLSIPNPRAVEGQSVSLRLGLSQLLDMDGVLFSVCDQPWLSRKSVERLLAQFLAFPDRICALSWQGKRGSPVIFPSYTFHDLLELTGDQGGRTIIRANAHRLHLVEVDSPKELQDVDTPFDLTNRKTELKNRTN